MKDKRDRKEFPYAEHLTAPGNKPLCNSNQRDPILLPDNLAANPPEALCPLCRIALAKLVRSDWDEFLNVITNKIAR